MIALPAVPFQRHPSFKWVSVLLTQLRIELPEGSTTLLSELHIRFNPFVLFLLVQLATTLAK